MKSIPLGDLHTRCQNTLRHYILSQMVALPPTLAPLRQSHICAPEAGPNFVSSFCALHGTKVTVNRSLGAGFDLGLRYLCLPRRALPIHQCICGLPSFPWMSLQSECAITDTCVVWEASRVSHSPSAASPLLASGQK